MWGTRDYVGYARLCGVRATMHIHTHAVQTRTYIPETLLDMITIRTYIGWHLLSDGLKIKQTRNGHTTDMQQTREITRHLGPYLYWLAPAERMT